MDAARGAGGQARGLLLGAGIGLAAVGLWVGLSLATGLIWHFHPALPGAAAGWGYRRGLGGPGGRAEGTALVALTAALVGLGGP